MEPLRGSLIDVYVIRASWEPLSPSNCFGVFPTLIQAKGYIQYEVPNGDFLTIDSLRVFKEDCVDRVFFLSESPPYMLNSDYDPKESEAYVKENELKAQALAKLTPEEAEVLLRGMK